MLYLPLILTIASQTCLALDSQILGYPPVEHDDENWKGKWFPSPPGTVDNNLMLDYIHNNEHAKSHIQMGIVSDNCDNGKTNLTIDWDDSPINYTCYEPKSLYLPDANVQPIQINYYIPKSYSALHKCMDTPITYNYRIPTFGPHRPLWPKYGEYLFVPIQRWLHSLEHGAIVMLYHPCANPYETEYLKKIVKNCLYRHIITPYTLLDRDRPLALVSWGHSLEMSKVDVLTVVNFIRNQALRGPEAVSRNGQYDDHLLHAAKLVSDQEDSNICLHMSSE